MNRAVLFLFNLRLQPFKQRTVKELAHRDAEAVTNLLNGHDTRVLAFSIQHAVNGRGGHAALIGKGIRGKAALFAQLLDTFPNCVLCVHPSPPFALLQI